MLVTLKMQQHTFFCHQPNSSHYSPFAIMDFSIPYSILFTVSCLFLMKILLSNSKKSNKNLPPGPWKLPLIGNLHQFLGSLPHHSLRNLANKHGPMIHLQLGETSNIVISSPEIAKEIMKTHDLNFANRPHFVSTETLFYDHSDIVFSPHGKYWRQLRKICSLELLSPKRVQTFRFIREEEVSAMIKAISGEEGSVVNVGEKVISLINNITVRATFGEKPRNQEALLYYLEELIKLLGGFSIADLYPSIKMLQVVNGMRGVVEKVHEELDRILENMIRDHKEVKGRHGMAEENLVDVLLNIQQQNDLDMPLTHNNIKAVILDIFAAGTETSSATIEWAMSELMRNPETIEKAQAEVRKVFEAKGYVDESDLHQLKYLKSVIKETLRLHPPAPLQPLRENSERCVINGYEIPAKSRIVFNAWAIGRDPKYWSKPEKFEPERFLDNPIDYSFNGTNFEYIPFGCGRRLCPGIAFATPSVELPLASLLYHFDWKLPSGIKHHELDMTESFAVTVKRKSNLCLIPVRPHI